MLCKYTEITNNLQYKNNTNMLYKHTETFSVHLVSSSLSSYHPDHQSAYRVSLGTCDALLCLCWPGVLGCE